jgi:UDP-N-acetylglucosamine 2-epimerase (non-hydrolysing)
MIAAAMAKRCTVVSVVGARPNFVKVAPVVAELLTRAERFEHVLVHTGQHYDDAMSKVFLEELSVGEPQVQLGVGSGSHAIQTARAMERLEPVLADLRPDLVLVPGDVNSTLAASLTAAKLEIPVGHIEAGLRSFDRTMPEELNRVLADAVSDLLFIHSPEARTNLLREGRPPEAIHEVGNTMIDTLVTMLPHVRALDVPPDHGLSRGDYLVVTLHRPALVDGPLLAEVLRALQTVAKQLPVVFPAHPRTQKRMREEGLSWGEARLRMIEPIGYMEFLGLLEGAGGALTDSGGIQEETTYLGVPCFTLRENTERPITCELGTNTLLGLRPERIVEIPALISAAKGQPHRVPPLWDGRAAKRLVDVIEHARLGAVDATDARLRAAS